ncbi:DUF5324 family protein [Streptacidiphilus fuscans]|uniref:DUF5324 family protein n=1 Tax=Streptacidiphilus fuscans TaxID=2789292 RepID=A0A931B789_9ACTN|nr:DUF5324 family protein [Streptacidiphilus fuscans]MBF9068190.1 DUF5324 family protein [Streptacidiphilus fuscans]
MSRIDAAREAASRTREQLTPYAVSAKDTAAQYADEARHRLAPVIGSAVEHARLAAQGTVQGQVVPLWEQARANVPAPVVDAGNTVGKAAGRARAAARQARAVALDQILPAAQTAVHEVHDRSAAALPVVRGEVSLAEIEALTAAHARANARRGRWLRRGITLLALGAMAGGGLAAWKWYQKQSNPDWLVEPPTTPIPLRETGPQPGGSSASSTVDGSLPLDPEVAAKEAEGGEKGDQGDEAGAAKGSKDQRPKH